MSCRQIQAPERCAGQRGGMAHGSERGGPAHDPTHHLDGRSGNHPIDDYLLDAGGIGSGLT